VGSCTASSSVSRRRDPGVKCLPERKSRLNKKTTTIISTGINGINVRAAGAIRSATGIKELIASIHKITGTAISVEGSFEIMATIRTAAHALERYFGDVRTRRFGEKLPAQLKERVGSLISFVSHSYSSTLTQVIGAWDFQQTSFLIKG
jgi:hypothetical protein